MDSEHFEWNWCVYNDSINTYSVIVWSGIIYHPHRHTSPRSPHSHCLMNAHTFSVSYFIMYYHFSMRTHSVPNSINLVTPPSVINLMWLWLWDGAIFSCMAAGKEKRRNRGIVVEQRQKKLLAQTRVAEDLTRNLKLKSGRRWYFQYFTKEKLKITSVSFSNPSPIQFYWLVCGNDYTRIVRVDEYTKLSHSFNWLFGAHWPIHHVHASITVTNSSFGFSQSIMLTLIARWLATFKSMINELCWYRHIQIDINFFDKMKPQN